MAITLITGPANAGKAQVVFEILQTHSARLREPIMVVPTIADVEHYRRELAERELAIGVRVEQFAGLIELAARRSGSSARPITADARRRLLAAIAANHRQDSPASTALTPGTLAALERLIAELESGHVSSARLRRALSDWAKTDGGEPPAAQGAMLAEVYERYQRTLERLGWSDPELHAATTLDRLRRSPAGWRGTPIVFYGFDDLSPLQLDAIETFGVIIDADVAVSVAYEPGRVAFAGRAGAFQALEPLASKHIARAADDEYYQPQSRAAMHHLERSLFEPSAMRVDADAAVRLLEGGGERAELELVAEEIKALLDAGVSPQELAVVHRTPAAIATLLEGIFRARQIPYSLQLQKRFAHSALGAAAIALLRCASGNGTAADLLRWLRAPGVLQRPELADQLELRVRRQGVRDADGARELWEAENWQLSAIDRLAASSREGTLELIGALERQLGMTFSAPRKRQAAQLQEQELEDAGALAGALDALEQLRELTLAAAELAPTPQHLLEALEQLQFTRRQNTTPEAVLVSSPLALRARRVHTLFLCGLQEGVFPAPAPGDDFLSGDQRRSLAETTGLRLGLYKDALASERYLFYACVSRPLSQLVLSWHTATDDGQPSAPSLFLDDVKDLFEDSLKERCVRRALGHAGQDTADAQRAVDQTLAPLTDPLLLTELRERAVFSASALETWVSCPMRWLVERLLRAQDIDPDPEPLARGALAHAALRDVFDGLGPASGDKHLSSTNLAQAIELLHQSLEKHASRHVLSAAPERLPGAHRRLQADLERYLRAAACESSPFEPRYLELPFGFPDEGELGVLDLGEGLRLRGRIDRIDVNDSQQAVLYDYKGKNVPGAAKWASDGHLQLALYARAAEELLGLQVLAGLYQPLSGRDLRARGAISSLAPESLERVRGDRLEHTQFTELLDTALADARQAASEIGVGALEPRPATCAYQGGCRYPTICRCEA